MNFLIAVAGDALLFAAVSWFAGYGAIGPATGLRLPMAAKLRLFAEVFVICFVLLYLAITLDQALGWVREPPWPGSPPPHRLIAIGIVLVAGFVHARRRSRSFAGPPPGSAPEDRPR